MSDGGQRQFDDLYLLRWLKGKNIIFKAATFFNYQQSLRNLTSFLPVHHKIKNSRRPSSLKVSYQCHKWGTQIFIMRPDYPYPI